MYRREDNENSLFKERDDAVKATSIILDNTDSKEKKRKT